MARPLSSWPAAVLAEFIELHYGSPCEATLEGIAARQRAPRAVPCECGGRGIIAEPDGPADWCTCEAAARLFNSDMELVARWNRAWILRVTSKPLRAAMATAVS